MTVFASGARVRRIATLRAPVPERVRLINLPIAVIDDTVRVEVEGGAVAMAVRAGWTTPDGAAEPEEAREVRAARLRHETAKAEVQRLELSLDRLAHAKLIVDDPSDEPPAAWDEVMRARRALVSMRAERQLALRQQLIAARREVDEARRALDVATQRDRSAGSARGAKAHEQRKHVEIDLVATPGATGDVTVRVDYQVAAARWAPSYVARLDGDGARFELRAVVAQDSGEDWTGVTLRLSTAEPDLFAPLPELQPQKIGRRQPEPARRGFRAAPAGAEVLYADYARAFPTKPSTKTGGVPTGIAHAIAEELKPPSDVIWDEGSSRSKEAYAGAPPPPMMMPPGAAPLPPSAPMPVSAPMAARSKGGIANTVVGGIAGAVAAPFALAAQGLAKKQMAPGGGGGMRDEALAGASMPAAPARLDYGNLRMASPDSPQRGKLVPAPRASEAGGVQRVTDAAAALVRLPLPPGHLADWGHTYDFAFASDGVVDVKSDGTWHSLALTTRSGTAKLRHVSVPREQNDVFRVARLTNPFDGPLLPGPIDVYDRGQFLVTSHVDFTPPGGSVEVGLGVDASVKIARNAEFHEEAAGMLRGALRLVHAVTVEVENLSPRTIDLEVRERVPVKQEGDDDVEVALAKVEPAWERWTPDPDAPQHARLRGAYRWRVEVAPRAKKLLRAGYEIKIANKNELVGGNRREP